MFWGVAALNTALLLGLLALVWRAASAKHTAVPSILQSLQTLQDKLERIERELRFEITESSRWAPGIDANLGAATANAVAATQRDAKVAHRHLEPTAAAIAKKQCRQVG